MKDGTIAFTRTRVYPDNIENVHNAIYTIDKAYVDFKALYLINQCDSFFITRAKDTMQHEIVETNYNIVDSIGLRGDHIIRLSGNKSSVLYPAPIRWLKQNLTIKKFWGYSENGVKMHLWVAICTFLIIARIKAIYSSLYTITEVATILSVSALEKIDLDKLHTNPELLNQKQNVNELKLF